MANPAGQPPFRADHIGSLLRPPALRQAFRDYHAGKLDDVRFGEIQDTCIREVVKMQEETGLEFASKVPGAMHACGHDAHSAMLVGAARALCARKDSLPGTVVFMFQPGEEGYHGARYMIEDGLLDIARPEAAFALHISPNAPAGTCIVRQCTLPFCQISGRASIGTTVRPGCAAAMISAAGASAGSP